MSAIYTLEHRPANAAKAVTKPIGPQPITKAICPGLISTSFNQKYAEDPTHGEAWGKETVVGRWVEPKDIVGAAVFLSSDESDFINGSEIKIDGGWLSSKVRRGELDNE